MARSRRQYDRDDYDDRPAKRRKTAGCGTPLLIVAVSAVVMSCGGCLLISIINTAVNPRPVGQATPATSRGVAGQMPTQAPVQPPVVPSTAAPEPQAEPEPKKWPYLFVKRKQESTGNLDVMDLYAYSEAFDLIGLEEFCRERKAQTPARAFYYVVIFDDKSNAAFPDNPFTATFNDERQARHVRAIYCYNRINGFSELDVYPSNMWDSKPNTIKP